jgi:hypothetical protein
MGYNIVWWWFYGLCTLSEELNIKKLKIKIATFRDLAVLPSSGEWRGRREEHLLSWAP